MKKVAYHGGVWKKKDLDKEYLDVKEAMYVAPTKDGAYLGINTPNKSGEEINTLFEIHYSNPNFFRDYRENTTELGQEGVWMGKNLRLKKIKDTMVKVPKRIRGSKALRYRYIVAEVDEEKSDRTPTNEEYMSVLNKFMKKFNKQCKPDYLNEEEKEFFYNSIQETVEKDAGKRSKTLETVLKSLSITAFLVGIFFLSPILTGNVSGNSSLKNNSIIGIVLLAISILGYFLIVKKKNKEHPLPKNKHKL